MTKTMKKPSYLGTTSQVGYQEALSGASGTYAEQHARARAAVGKKLSGTRVVLVRVAGKKFVVSGQDVSSLPEHIKPMALFVIEHCDEDGSIFLTQSA